MILYVVSKNFPQGSHDGRALQVNSFFGTPRRHTESTILANFGNAPLCVFKTKEEALQFYVGNKLPPLIFEVAVNDATSIVDEEENGQIYRVIPASSIQWVISATQNAITYSLTTTWQKKQRFNSELESLNQLLTLSALNNVYSMGQTLGESLKNNIIKFKETVCSLEGKLSYTELTDILKALNDYVTRPSLVNYRACEELARKTQGSPLPIVRSLGPWLLGICTFLAVCSILFFSIAALSLVVAAPTTFSVAIELSLSAGMGLWIADEISKLTTPDGLCKQIEEVIKDPVLKPSGHSFASP